MPEIARFYGLVVSINWIDHNPPHFHVRYSGEDVSITIHPIGVLDGDLPRRALSLAFRVGGLASRGVSRELATSPRSGAATEDSAIGLTPIWSIAAIEHLHDFVLRVTFKDGFQRDVDMTGELSGPIFEPLRDPAFFAQGRFDSEVGTIVWPNGADLAPEFLRWGPHRAKGCPCGYEDGTEGDLSPRG